MIWDFSIHSHHVIGSPRPYVIGIDKENSNCPIIDIAVPYDARMDCKKKTKIREELDLTRELEKL